MRNGFVGTGVFLSSSLCPHFISGREQKPGVGLPGNLRSWITESVGDSHFPHYRRQQCQPLSLVSGILSSPSFQ